MVAELTRAQLSVLHEPNEPFLVIGKILPRCENGVWTYTRERFPQSYDKCCPEEPVDYADYIGRPDRVVFVYPDGDRCPGRIRLRSNWNRYALIEDIAVRRADRGRGVGGALFRRAARWTPCCTPISTTPTKKRCFGI